jgi:hypothetical protein
MNFRANAPGPRVPVPRAVWQYFRVLFPSKPRQVYPPPPLPAMDSSGKPPLRGDTVACIVLAVLVAGLTAVVLWYVFAGPHKAKPKPCPPARGFEGFVPETQVVGGDNGAVTCSQFCNNNWNGILNGVTWTGATAVTDDPDVVGACTCVENPAFPYFTMPLSGVPQQLSTVAAADTPCDVVCNNDPTLSTSGTYSTGPQGKSPTSAVAWVAAPGFPLSIGNGPSNQCACVAVAAGTPVTKQGQLSGPTGGYSVKAEPGQTCEAACNAASPAPGSNCWTHAGSNAPGPGGACVCYGSGTTCAALAGTAGISLTP